MIGFVSAVQVGLVIHRHDRQDRLWVFACGHFNVLKDMTRLKK